MEVFDELDGEHGEVVALLGLADKGVDGSGHAVDNAFGSEVAVFVQLFDNTFIAKKLMIDILGFGETVGVGEDDVARTDGGLLEGVGPFGHDADGDVGVHF